MASGLWTAVSGAKSRSDAVDVIANNLANAATPAFKKDDPTFKEYLATHEREKAQLDIPRHPIKEKDFYPLDGKDQSFVITNSVFTDHAQGNLQITKNPFDLALSGPGFFEVMTPQGSRFTRQGDFKISATGNLVTREGFPVLSSQTGGLATALPGPAVQPGQGGPQTQGGVAADGMVDLSRAISLSDGKGALQIAPDGTVKIGAQEIAKLSLVEFRDPRRLTKTGGGYFENKDAANFQPPTDKTQVHQGALEASNVNPIQEMGNLIKAHRLFDLDMKSMGAFDSMMNKEANEIGKL